MKLKTVEAHDGRPTVVAFRKHEVSTASALPPVNRQNTDDGAMLTQAKKAQQCHARLQPRYLLAKAQDHYQTYGPGKAMRSSREKMVYMKERKALKTIAIHLRFVGFHFLCFIWLNC
ncbi:unnamed protein product [Gongylonema pulchrum]|uniref:Transposase n=1 Tax=Gongylonema pulchrum TaxID=637853 RepID=A0A183ER28_9BILA|nr:unnamed protein product [Gongylonema pulchrum]